MTTDGDPDILDLLRATWNGRRLVIWSSALCAAISVVIAFVIPERFRAEVLLVPTEAQALSGPAGALGGLVALAGVRVGGETAEAVATLKSRELARTLIEEYGLLYVFFEDEWDAEGRRWTDNDPEDWPDIRDAVEFFHEDVLDVSEEPDTGLVNVSVEWTDPDLAAEWATAVVRIVNERLRERALQESERNIAYLRAELEKTTVVPLQQSIGSLLETELQKMMVARGNEEFAFQIVDPAVSPKEQSWPIRPLLVVIGTVLGGLLGLLGVYVRHLRSRWRQGA